jgi:GNAT superfamily N-acetyltransferase
LNGQRGVVWREEALARHHDRHAFNCGTAVLNEYLQRYARQNNDSGGARTFVAVNPDLPNVVLGYYTISPGAIAFSKAPSKIARTLGRYDVPVFRLGRLAVALEVQGPGLGADLLYAAGERALAVAREVGGVGLAIDAKDERAAHWYERFGALRLMDEPLKLVLPLETLRAAFEKA